LGKEELGEIFGAAATPSWNAICIFSCSILPTLETFFFFLPPSLSKFLVPSEKRKSNTIELFLHQIQSKN
jgi:hypothetical protein